MHDALAVYVLVVAIGLSRWVDYARTVRGSTLVERNKEYVQAARVIGRHPLAIMVRHVLPNTMGPVLVIATINIATAIITEATLSFLGVGVPGVENATGSMGVNPCAATMGRCSPATGTVYRFTPIP